MSKRRINQKDIAENLNLSVATVSKALRGDYVDINSETREKVLNMATRLGYKGGSTIRQAILDDEDKKTTMVQVLILRKMHEWQHTNFFAGMSEKCAKMNVSLLLHYVNEDSCQEILNPDTQPPAMREGQVSGLILVNRWPAEIVRTLSSFVPCVSIQHSYPGAFVDVVRADEVQGVGLLMEHLASMGHEEIGFLGRCPISEIAQTRYGAYVSTLCKLGIEYDPKNVLGVTLRHLEDKEIMLADQIETALQRIKQGVRAWVCASDWIGYLLCRGLINRGVTIPKDVSVVGFDDSEDNTLGCPKMTSITVPALRIGAESLRRLLYRIRHPHNPPLRVTLPCKLFEAQTTAPLSRVEW